MLNDAAMDFDVGVMGLEGEVAGLGMDMEHDNSRPPFVFGEPSLALMSQPLDEDDNAHIPLTYESPSQLQIIDLHTNIYQMKLQESVYLKNLVEKEAKIENL